MSIEHDPLEKEFPDHRETIATLKQEDAEFQQLLAKYEAIDAKIIRMEDDYDTPDDALTAEKKKRLEMKDELYAMVIKAEE